MGEDAWTHLLSNGRTIGNTRGTHALTIFSCVTYTSPKVTNKLGLSFGSTKELNDIVDKALPGRPPFETHEVVVEGETLELHSRNILECIRSIYGDPEFTQDLAIAPECHYADQERTDRVFSEMYTGDWWWAVQVRNSILYQE